MSTDHETFEVLESDLNLFSIEVDGVPMWERIRSNVFCDISVQQGRGQAHTKIKSYLSDHLRGIGLWLKNAIYRNPYLAGDHEIPFFGHSRRKLEADGY